MSKRIACIGLMTAALVACGGSDDTPEHNDKPAQTASAEGFWSGTASTGYDVSLLVLENGETWGVYSSSGYIYGALVGDTHTNGNQLTGTGKDFNFVDNSVTPGSYSGTVSTRDSISVTLSNSTTFEGSYEALYDQPASLPDTDEYFFGYSQSGPASVLIEPSGAVSMLTDSGCHGEGTVKPRASGKNVFDLAFTLDGEACGLGFDMEVSGVVVQDSGYMIALALNGDQSDGFIYSAAKIEP